jgi:hypothetical protein
MANDIALEKRQELRRTLADKFGLPERLDSYFFLLRIGGNYGEYPFNWEPFRDLAGPLQTGSESLPIVVISDSTERQVPEVLRVELPIPHYELRVSPTIPVQAIATTWLDLLVDDGALHGSYHGPFSWFADNLEISADQLSEKARKFLSL